MDRYEAILRFIDGAMLADDACTYAPTGIVPHRAGDRLTLTRRITIPGVCEDVRFEISLRPAGVGDSVRLVNEDRLRRGEE